MENAIKATTQLNIREARLHIVNWLKSYCEKYGITGVTIGISGGIDSALASTLCAEAGLHVLCVEMPIHQNPEHAKRGQAHINWLGKNYDNIHEIDIEMSEAFDTLEAAFEKANHQMPYAVDPERHLLGLTNTRSRLRMIGLYQMATVNGFIVCGTGNKVEDFGVGFFTKYGDGGVDISPIADLLKSEVRAMAADLNILDEIVNAVPSDGLWDDSRSDEDQIGATYDELEWAMEQWQDGKNNVITTENGYSERQVEVMKIYRDRHLANKHKMDSIPVCSVAQFRS